LHPASEKSKSPENRAFAIEFMRFHDWRDVQKRRPVGPGGIPGQGIGL
jgi:hypothetical protein